MLKHRKKIHLSVTIFFLTTFFSPSLYADHVKAINPDGTLVLESGKIVCLLGLELSEEAPRFLPALLSKKDVDFEEGEKIDGNSCGYLYVNTSQMEVPFKAGESPDAKRFMVNEVLLKTGTAKVKSGKPFKHMEKFIALETEARKLGQGIWSYEDFAAQRARRRVERYGSKKES